jgi:hypothetical protein
MGQAEWNIVSFLALGWVSQFVLYGPKKVPTWFAYTALAAAGLGLYVIGNGASWADRAWWMGFVGFVMAARGSAGTSKDAKVAPKTDAF